MVKSRTVAGMEDMQVHFRKFGKDNPKLIRRLPRGMGPSRYFADRSANGGVWYNGSTDVATAPGMETPKGTYAVHNQLELAGFAQNFHAYQEFGFTKWLSLSEGDKHRHIRLYLESGQLSDYAKMYSHSKKYPPSAGEYILNHTFHEPDVPGWAESEEASVQRSPAFAAFYARLRDRFTDTYRGGFTHAVLNALEGTDRSHAMALAYTSVMNGDYECVSALVQLEPDEKARLTLLNRLLDELADGAECKLYVAYNLLLLTGDRTFGAYLRWHGLNGEIPAAAINYLVRSRVDKTTLEYLIEHAFDASDSLKQPPFQDGLVRFCGVNEHGRFTEREIFDMVMNSDASVQQTAIDEIWRIWREHPEFFRQ